MKPDHVADGSLCTARTSAHFGPRERKDSVSFVTRQFFIRNKPLWRRQARPVCSFTSVLFCLNHAIYRTLLVQLLAASQASSAKLNSTTIAFKKDLKRSILTIPGKPTLEEGELTYP